MTESEEVSWFAEFLREKLLWLGGISQTNAVIHDVSQKELVARVHLLKEKASVFSAIDTVCAADRLPLDPSPLGFLKDVIEAVILFLENSRARVGLWTRIELQCSRGTDDLFVQ